MSRLLAAVRKQLAPTLLAVAIALVISSIALVMSGHNPFSAYNAMWQTLNGTSDVVTVVNETAPLYVAAVALAMGFKMNLFNIGANGQFMMAALFAGTVGGAVHLPGPLHVLLIFVTAAVVGAAWAGIAGVLKVTRGVNEVVATIMLNGISLGVIGYLLRVYLRVANDQTAHTKTIPKSGRLPVLDPILRVVGFHIPKGTPLFSYVLVAVAVGIGFHVLIYRSRFGFDLRASGVNPSAARSSGVSPGRMIIVTMLLSGALAGLSGMSSLLQKQFEYGDRFPAQLGFTAIGVALLGQNHPIGIAVASFVWAAIEQGARGLPAVSVPQEVGTILQGSLLFVAVCVYAVTFRKSQSREIEGAARRSTLAVEGAHP